MEERDGTGEGIYQLVADTVNERLSSKADGKNADPLGCARRLSRVVCSDLGEVGMDSVLAIAEQVREAQAAEIRDAIIEVSKASDTRYCVVAGSGEFLAGQVLQSLGWSFTSISSRYGDKVSAVFPAYATARLLEEAG